MKMDESDSGVATNRKSTLARFRLKAFLAVVFLIIVAVSITAVAPRWQRRPGLAAQTEGQTAPTVTVVSPSIGQVANSMELPAEIKPLIEAPIYARANGFLIRRLVDLGDPVKAGQLLAEIDTPELDQELERARAQLAQTEASLGLAKITAARWGDLLKTASVSEQEAAEKQADFKLKTAVAESARAEVRRLEKLKSFANVTAPFSGQITARKVDIGDLIVSGNGKELFHLAQTQTLRVYVQVPQNMARSITPGQSAEMTLPELSGRSFKVRVVRSAGMISSDSRTLLVELEVDNKRGEILAGGYARVQFVESKVDMALTLPSNTIMFRTDGPRVAIVLPDSRVDLRKLKLGRDFGQTVEIVDGLSQQDQVIVNPPESLERGTTVKVAEMAKTEKVQ